VFLHNLSVGGCMVEMDLSHPAGLRISAQLHAPEMVMGKEV
jgi:hypothetical protein